MFTKFQQLEYINTIIIIHKKEGTLRFMTDYSKLNHQLVLNPYHLTILGEKMHKPEGCQYANALYLDVGCYKIHLFPIRRGLMTIVT